MSEDGEWDQIQCVSKSGKDWLDSGYILKEEPIAFAVGFSIECNNK